MQFPGFACALTPKFKIGNISKTKVLRLGKQTPVNIFLQLINNTCILVHCTFICMNTEINTQNKEGF